jgi:methanogenic corrinoid protein MtbC1
MPPHDEAHRAFLEAILAGDHAQSMAEARVHLARGVPYLYEGIIERALQEVGERWQQNRISVADEHLAAAIAQSVIASLYPEFGWPSAGPVALVTCVEGERHEIGARMFADLLALDGWRDVFLGADTPLDAMVAKASETKPVVVGLSVTLPQHLPIVRRTIAHLREAVPSVKVLVGGRAFACVSKADASVGADASCVSATGGVRAARCWKPAA